MLLGNASDDGGETGQAAGLGPIGMLMEAWRRAFSNPAQGGCAGVARQGGGVGEEPREE